MATEKKKVTIKKFALARELNDSDKCPPQAKVVVAAVKALGGKAERAAIIDELKKGGTLTTTQTVERIFGFYRPRLIDMGVLKEEVEEKTIDVEVADKAPKVEKPAKAETPKEAKPNPEGGKPAAAPAGQAGQGAQAHPHGHDVKDSKGSRQVA